MQIFFGVDILEPTIRLALHAHESQNFSSPQFLECDRLRKARRLDGDAQRPEYDIRRHMSSAVRHPEINLLRCQLFDRIDFLSGEDMDLLIVEFGDVLEIVLDTWKGRITLQR